MSILYLNMLLHRFIAMPHFSADVFLHYSDFCTTILYLDQFQITYWTSKDWLTGKFHFTKNSRVWFVACEFYWSCFINLIDFSLVISSPQNHRTDSRKFCANNHYICTTWFRASRTIVDSLRVAIARFCNHSSVHKSKLAFMWSDQDQPMRRCRPQLVKIHILISFDHVVYTECTHYKRLG